MAKKEEDKKRNDFKAGKQVGLSGREMFSFNPEMAIQNDMDDDETIDSYTYSDNEDDGVDYKEINLDLISAEEVSHVLLYLSVVKINFQVDGTGTVAPDDRLQATSSAATNGAELDGASAVPINENLFLEEDLEALDEELNDLDLEE